MKRAALVVVVAGLAACGHGDSAKRGAPAKEAVKRDREMGRALDQVRKSKLPPDAKKELEDAAKMLDDQR
jgi:hypothetical protein